MNCILPYKYTEENNELFRTCSNLMVNALVKKFKYLDFESMFMILFKHIVEYKCFTRLILKSKLKEEKVKQLSEENQRII